MDIRGRFFSRWKSDYDFKTITAAGLSLAVTGAFALYNGFLGAYLPSVWYGTICVYYIILTALRGSIILAEKRIAGTEDRAEKRERVCLAASALLLVLNVSLIVAVSMMVRQQKPVHVTLIPAVAMAAYTTYKVTMASIHLKRRKRSSDSLVRLLRTISFIDALVSVLTLQNTLIMLNATGEELSMLPLTAMTSAAVFLTVLLLSLHALVHAVRVRKKRINA